MKKLMYIILTAALLCAPLTGCSDDDSSSGADTRATDSTTVAESVTEKPSDVKPSDLAAAALGVGEWPKMAEITDADIISEDFEIDTADERLEDICIRKCPMSATMAEIIVIKAKKGEADYALSLLKTRKERLVKKFAFYPSDKEIAEAAIVGSQGDYVWLIAAEAAAKGNDALVSALG